MKGNNHLKHTSRTKAFSWLFSLALLLGLGTELDGGSGGRDRGCGAPD